MEPTWPRNVVLQIFFSAHAEIFLPSDKTSVKKKYITAFFLVRIRCNKLRYLPPWNWLIIGANETERQQSSFQSNYVTAFITYLSKMSSGFDIARIAVIVLLFLPMKPPNSIAAILSRFGHWHVQVPRILLAVVKLVVFCKILYPVLRLFLEAHRPRHIGNLGKTTTNGDFYCRIYWACGKSVIKEINVSLMNLWTVKQCCSRPRMCLFKHAPRPPPLHKKSSATCIYLVKCPEVVVPIKTLIFKWHRTCNYWIFIRWYVSHLKLIWEIKVNQTRKLS